MAGNVNQPAFQPVAGGTVSLSASTSSSNVEFQSANLSRHVRVYNAGAVPAFIAFGEGSGVTASATANMPIAPGSVEVFAAPHPYVAAITASGSTTLYFTPGEGQ
jgi:hypothetical protein